MSLDRVLANPFASAEHLRSVFVGRALKDDDIPTPSAVIDIARLSENCKLMLDAVQSIGVSFRAHVKTHKCEQITRLQVGADAKDVRLIVSALVEAEQLVPLLLDYKERGAKINVLYGVPFGPQQIERLAQLGQALGADSLTVMVDHPDQLHALKPFKDRTGFPIGTFIKTDTGYHRAGIMPRAEAMAQLVQTALELESKDIVTFTGFYSHAGHSYSGSSPDDAMTMLHNEIVRCTNAIEALDFTSRRKATPLTISVGASPTALSIQNLTAPSDPNTPISAASQTLRTLLSRFPGPFPSSSQNLTLEIHAGVYPLLDMQQLATTSRPLSLTSPSTSSTTSTTNPNPIALTILSTIHSLYPTPQRPHPEALTNAGTLALGREPCKSYPGWGVLSAWNLDPSTSTKKETGLEYNPLTPEHRLILRSTSQEHGLIAWDTSLAPSSADSTTAPHEPRSLPLTYGQKIRIYPNHACIAASMYGYYLVVDSNADDPDRIADVWVRWRGW